MSQGTNWVEIYSDVFNSDDPLYISVRLRASMIRPRPKGEPQGERVDAEPVRLPQGPGAGTRSTAAGVVSDIVELAEAMW